MTTQTDHLGLIAKTIETQYDLARIELFRPFERFDRFQGIKAKDFGHDCHPTYESHGFGHFSLSQPDWDALGARMALIRDAAQETALAHDVKPGFDVQQNIATCGCPASKRRGGQIVTYTVRVSIPWNGRTLTREYLLPEVKP